MAAALVAGGRLVADPRQLSRRVTTRTASPSQEMAADGIAVVSPPQPVSQAMMARALVVGRHGFFEFDLANRAVLASEGFAEILGRRRSDASRLRLEEVVDWDDWWRFRAAYSVIELGWAHRAAGDFRFKRSDGNPAWFHCRFDIAERDKVGRPQRLLIVASDVSDRRLREDRLERLALEDALTGLANRTAFLQRAGNASETSNALLLVDLDAFKAVNDLHGHVIGDAWLVEAARRLRSVLRRGDFIARIGGDEFAIIPEGRVSREALEDLAQRLVARLGEGFVPERTPVTVGASVGAVYVGEERALEISRLYACADRALYRAKSQGRHRYALMHLSDAPRRRFGGRS